MDRFQDMWMGGVLLSPRVKSNNYNHDAVIFTMLLLKELRPKPEWTTLLGNFSCLLESCATVFPIKNKFLHSIWLTGYFDFLFWFYSAILVSKMKLLFLNLYTRPWESCHYFDYWLPREVSTNLQIQRFPLMKFWYTISMYNFFNF